ncbi:MAG TPA: 50S ribosomal protein L30 [Longimicrobiales bacterium]|nr:50S ribosomal protein L30 [Longimicrobiales bacterium]
MLRITQVRSAVGRQEPHRRTLRALGLKRHQQSVVQRDNPAIRGMIAQISYMLDVQEVEPQE